jgi:hypothetical protein
LPNCFIRDAALVGRHLYFLPKGFVMGGFDAAFPPLPCLFVFAILPLFHHSFFRLPREMNLLLYFTGACPVKLRQHHFTGVFS